MKIGYMGIPFSNTEEAALRFARMNRWNALEIIPLMDSASVVEKLEMEEIDYGVVASSNIIAGPVKETVDSLAGKDNIDIFQTVELEIHHCLFVKDRNVPIDTVASHVQALLQTAKNLDRLYPSVKKMEVEDTAYAAEMLADGLLSDNVGVICRMDAGENYGLELLHENIEDDPRNITTFSLLRIK